MFKALNAQSIASRLFISAAFWSFTILILASVVLSAINRRSTEAAFDERLGVYLKALVVNVATSSSDESKAASVERRLIAESTTLAKISIVKLQNAAEMKRREAIDCAFSALNMSFPPSVNLSTGALLAQRPDLPPAPFPLSSPLIGTR